MSKKSYLNEEQHRRIIEISNLGSLSKEFEFEISTSPDPCFWDLGVVVTILNEWASLVEGRHYTLASNKINLFEENKPDIEVIDEILPKAIIVALIKMEDQIAIKRIDLCEFRSEGYLQEANRQFFHPLGLALEMDAKDGVPYLSSVWDYRDDPEGLVFADKTIDPEKIANVQKQYDSKVEKRKEVFGAVIQDK